MIPIVNEKYWYSPKQLLLTFTSMNQVDMRWYFSYGRKGKEKITLNTAYLNLNLKTHPSYSRQWSWFHPG